MVSEFRVGSTPAQERVGDGITRHLGFHPTFQVLRRSFSTHGQEEMRPKEMQVVLGHEDSRTTQEIYTQTLDAKVMQHVNDMANRLLGLEAPLASKQRH